jgi:hypothetical protein
MIRMVGLYKGTDSVTRLQEYKTAIRTAISTNDLDQVDHLLRRIRDDCVGYIQAAEHRTLPTCEFTFCYNRSDYEALVARYGADARNSLGISIGTVRGRNLVFIDVETPFRLLQSENPDANFIINISLVILEELLHVLYPPLSEDDINPKTTRHAEDFLGIQIPQPT